MELYLKRIIIHRIFFLMFRSKFALEEKQGFGIGPVLQNCIPNYPFSCLSPPRSFSILFHGIIYIPRSEFFRQFPSPLSSLIIGGSWESSYNKTAYMRKIDLYERHFACAVIAAEARHTAVPSANARSANTTGGGDGSSGSTWTSRIGASRSSGTNFRVRGFARSRADWGGRRDPRYDRCCAFPVNACQAWDPPWSTGWPEEQRW